MNEQVWETLRQHQLRLRPQPTLDLFRADARRTEVFCRTLGPLLFDFSKQRIDQAALAALLQLARDAGLDAQRAELFSGAPVNRSEARAALHMALRMPGAGADAAPALADAVQAAQDARRRMARLVETWRADTRVTDVVHVGIGGSDLGPRLVCEALAQHADARLRLHFVANVDAHAVSHLMQQLDARHTALCLVSKSFGTQETLLNGRALLQWLDAAGMHRAERVVAVTANSAAAQEFGITDAQILPLWDWVGGRYSLWSAVGLPIALTCGMPVFERLLHGAHAADEHYRSTPLDRNIPVLMALVGLWNRNLEQYPTQAVVPYDDRLRLLPSYLQQLDMESNGKGVDEHGAPLTRPGAPVLWGEVGTNAQHAFFQSLHQGLDVVPVEFLGVVRPAHERTTQHRALLANLLAQGAALMRGTPGSGPLAAHQRCPGNRPSTTILLESLTPEALGTLLAVYEHKIHAQGRLWGINSFDQWGVELGKRIARDFLPAITEGQVPADADPSTGILLRHIYRLLPAGS